MNEANPAELVPYVTGGAFALAFIFGAVGNKTNFCTMAPCRTGCHGRHELLATMKYQYWRLSKAAA